MNLQPFLKDLAAAMEVDVHDLTESYELVWESIIAVSAITLLSRHFDLTLDVEELRQCQTIGALCQVVTQHRLAA